MSKIENGGAAFPLNSPSGTPDYMPSRDGMSLRDWFAGQLLAGMCASPDVQISESTIRLIWKAADEMIKARTEE